MSVVHLVEKQLSVGGIGVGECHSAAIAGRLAPCAYGVCDVVGSDEQHRAFQCQILNADNGVCCPEVVFIYELVVIPAEGFLRAEVIDGVGVPAVVGDLLAFEVPFRLHEYGNQLYHR